MQVEKRTRYMLELRSVDRRVLANTLPYLELKTIWY